jgi:hypothetical protein
MADCLEMFIEKDCARAADRTANCNQWAISPSGPDGRAFLWVGGGDGSVPDESDFTTRWKRTPTGYVIEFRLSPKAIAPAAPVAGTKIGFHYVINNDGEAVEQFTMDKDFSNSWRRPDQYGVIQLAP